MASAVVIAAALTTPQTRTLVVFAGGMDVTSHIKWSTFSVTDSGTNAKGTCQFTIEGAAANYPGITDQALVRVEEPADANPEVFRGFVRARRPGKDPRHPTLEVIADDITTLLDDALVPVELRQPETMQARIGYLWGKYAGQFLSGDLSFVASVGGTLPLQRFEAVSLRQAIEMTIAQASSTADYYLDMLGRLHVFVTETNDAPFDIDADAPGAGEIAPEMLDVEHDSNAYANRVYVKGATPEASIFVQDEAAIAAANGLVRTAMIQATDVTTEAMARSLGQMYLGRVKTAKPRGVFQTHSPNDGWRGGQNVLVTSADHALSAQSYRIARVTTKVLKPGTDFTRSYRVEFGGAQAGSGIDGQPALIAGASSGVYMLDQLSSSIVSNIASAQLGGIGPALRRFILSGVYNGDFYAPPPGPDAPIDNDTNPLPYWNLTKTGTDGDAFVMLDSTKGSGRVLRLTMGGSGADSVKVDQLIPINSGNASADFNNPKIHVTNGDTAPADITINLITEYRLIDGVTATGNPGSAARILSTLGAGGSAVLSGIPNAGGLGGGGRVPTDAYFLYFSVLLDRGSGSNTAYVDINQAWLESGQTQVPQGAIATRTSTQTITTATWTPIQFSATDISDPFGFHNPASDNTRFTVPTGWGGTYLLVGNAEIGSGTTGVRYLGWGLNGAAPTSPHINAYGTAIATTFMNVETVIELAAGDYVELQVWQTQGADQTLAANARGAIYYIGETV